MSETTTIITSLARTQDTGASTSKTTFTPEVAEELRRRLGIGALIYAGAWVLAQGYFVIRGYTAPDGHKPDLFHYIVFAVSIAMALSVWLATRRSTCSPAGLARFAMLFLLLGSLGIASGMWEGPELMARDFERMAAASGVPSDPGSLDAFAKHLEENRAQPFHVEGPTWVAVWLLAFPFIFPMSPLRTIFATFASAAMIPAVLGLSLLVNGLPTGIGIWMDDLMLDFTIPTVICAIIASAIATHVYKLTRDLSRARALGSYELVERIGAGGMGEVWLARHHMLARPAAIKLIRPDALGGPADASRDGRRGIRPRSGSGTSSTLLKRFEREAQATANLSSPNTIEIYDFGVTQDGTFYYVMELLDGVDLDTLVERHGPISPSRVIHFLSQACHSLADAHATNLVHRDVKPANLFTCRRGQDVDVVKVLDFGLVKGVESRAEDTRLTMEGSTTGTPAFMAPEMVYGHDRVDARADIYALGCVGYWLLTGTLVFEGDSPMAVLVQHAKEAPPPPSTRTERPVPRDLERVILDCLAKDPDARPASAGELSARLAACEAFGTWSAGEAARWWQTHLPPSRTAGAPPEAPAASMI